MKRKLKTAGILVAAAAVVALVPALMLAGHGDGSHWGGHKGHGDGAVHGMHMKMLAKLDLDESQTEQIHTLIAEHHEAMEPEMDRMREVRRALAELVHADDVDESAIRQAAAQLGAVEGDVAVSRARLAQEVKQVLTPQQQEQAKQMIEDFRSRMQERGGRGAGRGSRDHLQGRGVSQ